MATTIFLTFRWKNWNRLNKLPWIIQLVMEPEWDPGSSQVPVVLMNAEVLSPKSAVIISSQCPWIMVRMVTVMVIMFGSDITPSIVVCRVLYIHFISISSIFTTVPLWWYFYRSHYTGENLRGELPKVTKLLSRGLELTPHLPNSKTSPLPISRYSRLKQSL